MCEWFTTGDNGRSGKQDDIDQWLLDLRLHYNAVEEGIRKWYVCCILWLVLLAVLKVLIIWKLNQHIIFVYVYNQEFNQASTASKGACMQLYTVCIDI